MFQTKVVEKIKAHILRLITFDTSTVYDTMRKNVVHPDRPQIEIWRMRIAC